MEEAREEGEAALTMDAAGKLSKAAVGSALCTAQLPLADYESQGGSQVPPHTRRRVSLLSSVAHQTEKHRMVS